MEEMTAAVTEGAQDALRDELLRLIPELKELPGYVSWRCWLLLLLHTAAAARYC